MCPYLNLDFFVFDLEVVIHRVVSVMHILGHSIHLASSIRGSVYYVNRNINGVMILFIVIKNNSKNLH